MKTNRKGFTLVEIMIVVAIIGILAIIAIPNFIRARRESQKNACIANMKQIMGAFEQYKLAGNTDTPTVTVLASGGNTAGSESFLKVKPLCPRDKSVDYTIADDGVVQCLNQDATEHDVNTIFETL